MSTYQFFIILHGLKDVLVWLVPLLIAILLCVTAIIIAFRWIRARRAGAEGIAALSARVNELENRLTVLETRDEGAVGRAGEGEAAVE